MIEGTISRIRTLADGTVRFEFDLPYEQAPLDSMRHAYKKAFLSFEKPAESESEQFKAGVLAERERLYKRLEDFISSGEKE